MLPADLLPSVLCSMPVFSAGQTVALVVALMCLVVSGFVSGSEIAFFSLTPAQCEELDDTPRGPAIRRLLGMPERLLATILIANNLVNVTIVVLCNFALGPVFGSMPALWSFVLQTVILTFLILLFGEILPKIYASNYSTRWARFAAPGINFFERLFSPLSGLLVRSSGIVKRVVSKHADPLTADELSTALDITDVKAADGKEILQGIIKFGDTAASEIMTPRIDITDIDMALTFEQVMKVVVDSGYSRLPVYDGTQDNIRGVLYSRDLLPYVGREAECIEWQKLLREPYFVPESRMIDDLLEDFRKLKIHMAIVVDEFGGTQVSSRWRTCSKKSWATSTTNTTSRTTPTSAFATTLMCLREGRCLPTFSASRVLTRASTPTSRRTQRLLPACCWPLRAIFLRTRSRSSTADAAFLSWM